MMKMLECGGLPPLCDGIRAADHDNPNGYYEFEKVKNLKDDDSWINEADGKSLKVISTLLSDLPVDQEYRIIFMVRNLDEILSSQRKMIERRNVVEKSSDEKKLKPSYKKHLKMVKEWLSLSDEIELFYCDYNQLVADPARVVHKLLNALNLSLNADRMAAVVDNNLYRQRHANGASYFQRDQEA